MIRDIFNKLNWKTHRTFNMQIGSFIFVQSPNKKKLWQNTINTSASKIILGVWIADTYIGPYMYIHIWQF